MAIAGSVSLPARPDLAKLLPRPAGAAVARYDERLEPLDATGFSPEKRFTAANAGLLCSLATLTYKDPDEQVGYLGAGFTDFVALDSRNNVGEGDTGTQVSLFETPEALIVAPRGTPLALSNNPDVNLQWQDLKNDLDALPTRNYAGNALVHRGFKRAADGIWTQLKPHLQSALAAHKAIHMTGHSLGAAIATHLADRMFQEMGELPTSLVTLGAPAVGWSGEHRHLHEIGLEERTVRFIRNLDPVPLAVPGGEPLGQTVYLNSAGQAELGGGWHLKDRLVGLGQALSHLQLNPLQEHYPVPYTRLVQDPANQAILSQLAG